MSKIYTYSPKCVSSLVESFVFTPEKLKMLGLPKDAFERLYFFAEAR